MTKACIFDLDGTLADTLQSLTDSVTLTMQALGHSGITKEDCARFVGNGARMLLKRSLTATGGSEAELDQACELYRQIFDVHCTDHVQPYAGIPELLRQLKDRGVKLAVFSNKPHAQTVKVVETIFEPGLFDLVLGQGDAIPRKPDPAGMEAIRTKLDVSKDDCLYVGDSEVDIATGEASLVPTVIVTWGFRSREELLQAGASPDRMIDQVKELWTYVCV